MTEGCHNAEATKIPRHSVQWSDGRFDSVRFKKSTFDRLKCDCGSISFEVLAPQEYMTVAMCHDCKRYYIVHCG